MPHKDTRFLSIWNIDNLSTYGIDQTFVYVLGIYKLSILCIDNTSTYDIYKTKFLLHIRNFITLFNFINAVIHNNHSFHTFHIKD